MDKRHCQQNLVHRGGDFDDFEKEKEIELLQIPPYQQISLNGLSQDKVICNPSFEKMKRPASDAAVCVKESSVEKLIAHGWQNY